MNEIQLLREQLAAERRHVREVAAACAAAYRLAPVRPADAALGRLRRAGCEYLGCVLGWFEERDARLRAYSATSCGDAGRRALEVLGTLAAEGEARAGWEALCDLINGPWDGQRSASAALLDSLAHVADWRAVAAIDADSIYRERALYAQVRAALPPGVALA